MENIPLELSLLLSSEAAHMHSNYFLSYNILS